jgi:hypothetical protein
MSLLPTQLISSIVDLSNRSNEKSAVVVSIDPETGKQSIEPNPVRLDLLKETVKESAKLLKKHRRLFTLHEQINEKIETEEDLDEDEYIDDPDYFKEIIAELAEAEIRRSDNANASRMQEQFGVNWGEPVLFDLVLNTDRMSVDTCVGQIKALVARPEFAPTESSRAMLQAMALQARVRSALRAKNGSKSSLLSRRSVLRKLRLMVFPLCC